ncbi:TonB-dependent receptor [Reichenbachiella ulvae]|uniref:TonB-dependent receptor n=1 Tax=Reichenbachiella ulvae TaxID=2980104 RepID=A0ABT3CR34_9BACT|nr:TonB-dependent receptor [Reichenbachiella ulvae]MCV9386156.1 TonB-dependent receptor [Reichenbachiella ulvae]
MRAQSDKLSQVISISKQKYSVRSLLEKVLPENGVFVSYNDDIIPMDKQIVFKSKNGYKVESILEKICRNENLSFEVKEDQILIKFYDRPDSEYKYVISGSIKDVESGELLIGAAIYIPQLKTGVSTNAYGFYSFTLTKGVYNLEISYIGYEAQSLFIDINKNLKRNVELTPKSIELTELHVDELNPLDIKAHSILSSTNRIDMNMAKQIPYLGEVDVFQSSLLLPGITNIGEGVSGINVRGGNSDQNLILMDEAMLYSSNHFFGLISIFNPDAVKDVEILKGDFPAKYGGRTSAVMHVRQKEGNERETQVSGGIGLLTSRLMVEGPMLNNKASYLLSGRSTFWDLILRNLKNPDFNDIRANFQDVNGKVKFNINSKNKIYLSGYWGADATKIGTDAYQTWGNRMVSFRWNSILRKKHFFNTTAYYSGYRYRYVENEEFRDFTGRISIDDFSLKLDVNSYLNPNNILEWGASSIYHKLLPGELISGELDTSGNEFKLEDETGIESSIYLSSENRIGSRITTLLGLRVSHFLNNAESDVYIYQPNVPKSVETITDTLKAGNKESKTSFWNILPRASLKLLLLENTSAKISYSSSVQYMHLLSNFSSPTSSDNWVMTGRNINPTEMYQGTLGVYRYFPSLEMNVSAELYYRRLDDVIDYKNGANLFLNPQVETELIFGDERAYGMELFVKKTFGRWTGWVGYTLSRVERKFDSQFEELTINEGNYFPSDFDRTHDFALTMVFNANEKWSFSSNFVFYTGRPYSFPDSKYEFDGILIPNYPSKNQDRLSNYHRLDLSATCKLGEYKRTGQKRGYESNLVFSVYNVYARKNAQAYFFSEDEDRTGKPVVNQLSVLAFPVPSITYNFIF